MDRTLQIGGGLEQAALELPPRQQGEPAFDKVEPRGRGRGEV